MRRKRKWCPDCGRHIAVTVDGNLMHHGPHANPCQGIGKLGEEHRKRQPGDLSLTTIASSSTRGRCDDCGRHLRYGSYHFHSKAS